MPVLSLACHLPHNTPNIPSRYNNEQTTKQTKAINNSYIYIYISCKCDTNRAGHFTLDAYASRPVACHIWICHLVQGARVLHLSSWRAPSVRTTCSGFHFTKGLWAHNPNFVKLNVAITYTIINKSGHNFAHVTTAWLSWQAQIYDLIG